LIACGVLALFGAGCVQLEFKERELTFRPSRDAAYWFGACRTAYAKSFCPWAARPMYRRSMPGGIPSPTPAPRRSLSARRALELDGAAPGASSNYIARLFRVRDRLSRLRKSDGDLPSEETVYADALAGGSGLAEKPAGGSGRFIYGHSLGGAVAIDSRGAAR